MAKIYDNGNNFYECEGISFKMSGLTDSQKMSIVWEIQTYLPFMVWMKEHQEDDEGWNEMGRKFDEHLEDYGMTFMKDVDTIRGYIDFEFLKKDDYEEEPELKHCGWRAQGRIGECEGCKAICDQCENLMIVEDDLGELEFDTNAMDEALSKDDLTWSFDKPKDEDYLAIYITKHYPEN